MDLSSVSSPLDGLRSGRFLTVGYLPAAASAIFLLVLVWSGAPLWLRHGDHLSFTAAWKVAKDLGAGEIVLLTVVVTLIAVVLVPLQLAMMRVLEGGWPVALGSGLGRRCQVARKRRLAAKAVLPQERGELTDDVVQKAGRHGARLRRRYPLPEHLMRATALGNALAAMEDTAGRDYGLDAVVAWPRLYPLLGDKVRLVVDDRRDVLDGAGRMAVTAALTTVAALGLLWGAGWWPLLAIVPAVLAAVSYTGAVAAAVAYGEAVGSAFDLHRFDLLKALKLRLPKSPEAERLQNEALCAMWRQGVPMEQNYEQDRAAP
ncbi:hypothetical protein [Actinoplanes sp. L3-i22]|uniref:hypothetical protein n=1 Tax=Actinoplanes sp. L3-i22 TaxID=2836373 RepID=UPI001C77BC88|nr:hypothetical protein [Actinoplanes sp. L3-i22]BCY08786.1 hypothetical protein L3i22_038740 [Actinoplanes sp. L3-i22]